jgi:transcriptional regulator with XRE-family HTH domain
LPRCKLTFQAKKPDFKPYPKQLKTIGDHLKKRRLDLNLQQTDVASRLGTTACTLRNWEKNRNTSQIKHLPKVIDFLSYQPWDEGCRTLCERIALKRKLLGLSQEELAKQAGLCEDTIASWENGEHKPNKHSLKILAQFFTRGGSVQPVTRGFLKRP